LPVRFQPKPRRLAVSLVTLMLVTPSAVAREASCFKIGKMSLARALIEFAEQADISMVRPPLHYGDGENTPLTGCYSVDKGLARLLKGTDYSFEILAHDAVKIVRKPRKMPKHPPAPVKATTVRPERPHLEEIVVSTTRRNDYDDHLPYAISVTSRTTLDRLTGAGTGAAALHIVGLAATDQGESRSKLIIRGLSDGAFSGRTQSLVSTYLDYSRMTYNAPEPSFKLVDLATVEVLRGPQGTLYGSGALGGLYRLVTNKPDSTKFASAASAAYSLTKGGTPSNDVTAMVNLPVISNKLAVRAVAYNDENGGYIDDVRLGLKNVNHAELSGGRIAAGLQVGQDWLITGGFNIQHHSAEDTSYYNRALGQYNRDNYVREPRTDLLMNPYLTVEAHLPWFDLVSNTSWLDRDMDNYYDASLAIPALSTLPVTPSTYEDDRHIKTLSNETHLTSTSSGRLEWMAGFYLAHRDEQIAATLDTPGSASIPGYGPTDTLYSENLTDHLHEAALFGEITYYLTERFSITGGLRWFYYLNRAESVIDDVGLGGLSEASGRQRRTGFVPKLTFSFQESEHRLYYLQFAEGYRLGDINLKGPAVVTTDEDEGDGETALTALTTFKPDRTLNIEAGLKQHLMEDRLALNAAVFYTRWNDIQSDQYNTQGLPTIGNVGNGRVFGAELEFDYRPVRGFEVSGGIAWHDADLTHVSSPFGTTVGATVGEPLPGAPAFSFNIAARKSFPLGHGFKGAIDVDYSHVGGADLLFNATAPRRSDAYHRADVRFEVSKGAWEATLFVDNLLNSSANAFSFGNPFSLASVDQVTPVRPRTFGLRLSWTY